MNERGAVCALVVPAGERLRVDRFLSRDGRWGTRSQVHRLIDAGGVEVNGGAAKPGTVVRGGDVVRVDAAAAPSTAETVAPEDIPLRVLYEDDDLLVIDKPAGLVVHPAPGHWQGTLVSALLHRWGESTRAELDELCPGIVHRLDRQTSGVLVIAKNAATVARLGAQFRSREVHKEYIALVWGRPRLRRGTIDQPIGRHPTQRKRMAVRESGRTAVTGYEVVEELGACTLVRAFPRTGRTHQVRVHLAALGHPLVGDRVYGRGRTTADPVVGAFPRHALHAAEIRFRHPRSGAEVRVSAPVPADLEEILRHLRRPAR